MEAGDISPRAMKQAIMTNCRNKLCFNGVGFQDAQEFADEFGKDKIMMRQSTYKHHVIMPTVFPDSYRDTESEEYRFDPTDIMDNLPKYSFIHKVMYEAAMQKPALARGNLVPSDWKEKREWEDHGLKAKLRQVVNQAEEKTGAGLKRPFQRLANVKQKQAESTPNRPEPVEDNDKHRCSVPHEQKTVSDDASQNALDENHLSSGLVDQDVSQLQQEPEPIVEPPVQEQETEQKNTSAKPNQPIGQAADDGFWD
ncbi:type IV secretory system conjugative DNA transfer family protein [Lentibacillus cibarius]|uniref:Uncharacterized protein n=1 Tax=Lentibacillus cibarius TaxID=2583219 RepID=A0A5S3QGA9_9BACI|nr:hypothetical protein [Lentibacillus cibarius]TMN20847.1 hypothetical protein FFL34_01010 [Lentibacillus cibarius]